MTEAELNAIPVDIWLLGHTHIPYPNISGKEEKGYKIFNAGTHEQTDLNNNTVGSSFVISIENLNGQKIISAHSYLSGYIRYHDQVITIDSNKNERLRAAVKRAVEGVRESSVIRLSIRGSIEQNEYDRRGEIYSELLGNFLTYEIVDDDLNVLITAEKVKDEFPEISFAANLLRELLDDPKETQLAYNLLNECREK